METLLGGGGGYIQHRVRLSRDIDFVVELQPEDCAEWTLFFV
jgi:hypothetical protein